jgi:four helix bundle protein
LEIHGWEDSGAVGQRESGKAGQPEAGQYGSKTHILQGKDVLSASSMTVRRATRHMLVRTKPELPMRVRAQRHEQLKAWTACHELALAVYEATKSWPSSELYTLTSQARRAAYSAAANIAEGSAKKGSREFRRYLDTSLGSLAELSYVFVLARDLGYLKPEIC